MARFRPCTDRSSAPWMNDSRTGSLHTLCPGWMVTDPLPPKVTAVNVSFTTLAEYSWSPTVTVLKVTGLVPKTLEKRIRIVLPQRSGFTMDRKVWSTAEAPLGLVALGNGKARSGWMFAAL